MQYKVESVLQSCGVDAGQSILVALSGGADSMALLHVLNRLGFACQAAHCNFQLRDQESDDDERFVVDFCMENDIPLHVKQFNTIYEARKNGISIEMAARDLRYTWFWRLVKNENFHWLATGHHGDDMIETFFLNLARGTGLRGLKGMECQNEKLIRPLLALRRDEIESYCVKDGVPFRTDSTNSDVIFKRNNIRHNVLPVMNSLNPSFFDTMMDNFRNLNEIWQIFQKEVELVKNQVVAREDDHLLIPVKLIKDHPQRRSILFEILRPFNFNATVISGVIDSLDGIAGKQFFSKTHRLVRDRFNLVVVPRETQEDEVYYIQSDEVKMTHPVSLEIRLFERNSDFEFSRYGDCANLDADLVEFPLKLRHWRKGDQFRPLGMETYKKLSDFFIDGKFSLIEKEKVWILLSGDDIIWVVGHRIDDRYKVTSATENILELKISEG
jgi:tRNA(Ile)-lysidine synthase